ncbi:MAG: hypothetical protein QHH15_06285, partial [Candidatus Thermoplasmatota archaeon]|nr:hypothetical protein [Candidatus Thermoplasmatota archaeon]
EYTLQEGFYVDDISPVPKFNQINTLSNSITGNFYNITNKKDGDYFYRVRGYNSQHNWGDFSTIKKITVKLVYNKPPNIPVISGPVNGKPNIEYVYNITTTDPEENDVYFYLDWGDGNNTGWIGPYNSGEEISLNHKWSKKGIYVIKVKAKDIHEQESDWTFLEIKIPKNRFLFNSVFLRLLDQLKEIFKFFILIK